MKCISLQSQHVSLARRLGAMFYDLLLLAAILIGASFVLAISFKIYPEHPLFIIYQSCVYVVSFLFYAWFWTHGGQTLGMKIWKFRITSIDGSTVDWVSACVRFMVAIASWLPFGLGYLWSLIDKNKRTWHDIASKTQLVRY